MFTRTVSANVDARTFVGGTVPAHLVAPRTITIDLIEALMLLGNVTVPGGFTTASPARFWAWVRYFSAISAATDLRITWPFADLDPHQKGILSDDFGIAICTQWLIKALGGVRTVVDGRRFLLQYSSLLAIPPSGQPPKVGEGNCPDFVLQDKSGKWHVLECKGTQVGLPYRNKQLKTAVKQKKVIGITDANKGDQLAAGLFIGNDRDPNTSHLRVVDPPSDPYVTIEDGREQIARKAVARLSASRALGLSGLNDLGDELSLPPEVFGSASGFLRPRERERIKVPAELRFADALQLTRTAETVRFSVTGKPYVGREATFEIPGEAFLRNTGFRRVRIRQGTSEDFVESMKSITSDPVERIDQSVAPLLGSGISVHSQTEGTTIRDGSLFVATLNFD